MVILSKFGSYQPCHYHTHVQHNWAWNFQDMHCWLLCTNDFTRNLLLCIWFINSCWIGFKQDNCYQELCSHWSAKSLCCLFYYRVSCQNVDAPKFVFWLLNHIKTFLLKLIRCTFLLLLRLLTHYLSRKKHDKLLPEVIWKVDIFKILIFISNMNYWCSEDSFEVLHASLAQKLTNPKFLPMIFLFLPSVSSTTSWGQTNSLRNLTRVPNEF